MGGVWVSEEGEGSGGMDLLGQKDGLRGIHISWTYARHRKMDQSIHFFVSCSPYENMRHITQIKILQQVSSLWFSFAKCLYYIIVKSGRSSAFHLACSDNEVQMKRWPLWMALHAPLISWRFARWPQSSPCIFPPFSFTTEKLRGRVPTFWAQGFHVSGNNLGGTFCVFLVKQWHWKPEGVLLWT